MVSQPDNVGILAMEIHFPPTRLVLEELEAHDGASKGEYTTDPGQNCMGFVIEDEDVVSISLTAVTYLLEKYAIDPKQIGRLDVGIETITGKSKSIKTFLMRIHGETAALFNCVNWVERSSWDGHYGLVVCTDSAVFTTGPARATGGAAAIAMLVGPDAPIVLESKIRASHMSHVVDSEISQTCYLKALDSYHKGLCNKYEKLEGEQISTDDAAYFVFHSPYNKAVINPMQIHIFSSQQVAKPFYDEKVEPTTLIPKQVGSKYTASLYAAFASVLHNKHDTLRVIMFSYGGGSTATMFSLKLNEGQHPFSLSNIASVMDVAERLQKRIEYTPEEFDIFVGLYEVRRKFDIKNDYWCRMPGPLLPIGTTSIQVLISSTEDVMIRRLPRFHRSWKI
ncbi:unnamed protein product [Withania somnifera]